MGHGLRAADKNLIDHKYVRSAAFCEVAKVEKILSSVKSVWRALDRFINDRGQHVARVFDTGGLDGE